MQEFEFSLNKPQVALPGRQTICLSFCLMFKKTEALFVYLLNLATVDSKIKSWNPADFKSRSDKPSCLKLDRDYSLIQLWTLCVDHGHKKKKIL